MSGSQQTLPSSLASEDKQRFRGLMDYESHRCMCVLSLALFHSLYLSLSLCLSLLLSLQPSLSPRLGKQHRWLEQMPGWNVNKARQIRRRALLCASPLSGLCRCEPFGPLSGIMADISPGHVTAIRYCDWAESCGLGVIASVLSFFHSFVDDISGTIVKDYRFKATVWKSSVMTDRSYDM